MSCKNGSPYIIYAIVNEKNATLLYRSLNMMVTTVATDHTLSATLLRPTSYPPYWSRRLRCLGHPRSLSTLEVGEGSTVPP